ncbi:DUF3327 domain-containing protein [Sphingomonas sp. RHCKR7]|uniref:enterochelin esterase domain-containing protein n=1 Tax=Sphingomonas folli TaxID=2862497 RepID=UPI001CA5F342|nr:DUF3327 domain-containing protein [Sphingomonas folli]
MMDLASLPLLAATMGIATSASSPADLDRRIAAWWRRPVVMRRAALARRASHDTLTVTFVGREAGAAVETVDVDGPTDHRAAIPPTLRPIGATPIWWRVTLPADRRGSHALLPAGAAERPPRAGAGEARRVYRARTRCPVLARRPDPGRALAAGRARPRRSLIGDLTR